LREVGKGSMMENNRQHIDTAIVSRRPGITYGDMYSMHRYWSKKSSDVIAAYIERYTKRKDIVLDPFCGSGIVACEAIRLDRRAIAIDINPIATFITRMTLTPVNLSRLQWAFRDVKSACEEAVSELFITKCPTCGQDAVVDFVVRDGDIPTQIGYRCNCSRKRLFKDPDERDKNLDRSFEKKRIPFWYPCDVPIPIIQKERFQFLHELFTRRNLIALSTILNAIEGLGDLKIREVMKLAFTAALDKCSRLKPLSRSKRDSPLSLSEGWVAVRFYAPRMWQEVNPWYAFARSFERVYKGKKESNAELKDAIIGSSYEDLHAGSSNVIILTGSADTILNRRLPEQSVDYILTDPPFGGHIKYSALSTFWGAWLKFDFDYDRELVVNRHIGKTTEDYERHLGEILASMTKVSKPSNYIHVFYHDVRGTYLHRMLKLMSKANISPERILHQPPPNSFGAAVRNISETGKGHYGSYIVRGRILDNDAPVRYPATEDTLRKKVAATAHMALEIGEGSASVGTLLHLVYQKLSGEEILAFAQHPAKEFLQESIREFAVINKGQAQVKDQEEFTCDSRIKKEIRATLLDAKALYADQKNQVRQSVLRQFQEKGTSITLDLICRVEQDILEPEVTKHRMRRWKALLHDFGTELGFRCISVNGAESDVVWEGDAGVTCSFQVTDKEIMVKASRALSGENFEIGTISFLDLEDVLWKWRQGNPDRAHKLRNAVNPVNKPDELPAQPRHLRLKVIENRELCPRHYLITLQIPKQIPKDFKEPQPGQFFHVVCDPDGKRTLTNGKERGYALTLRRPFGVHRVHYADFDRRLLATPGFLPYEVRDVVQRPISKIDILYKVIGEETSDVIGKGTRSLSQVRPGRLLDVIGPIGKGFKIERGCTGVIVGGGIGIAPLVALAEKLRYLGCKVFPYFGALRKELLQLVLSRSRPDSVIELSYANGTAAFLELIRKEFAEIGTKEVRVSTDDGSLGEKGPVTDMLEKDIESDSLPRSDIHIYACGPPKMIRSVSDLADKYQIPCQVLLEERMACGIGACFSCTCNIRGENGKEEKKRVCIDGPVFDAKEIIW
jgi:NAD(P)H-flavin reductase/16S rRNA G966 N2-methylase RsmD